MEMVSMLVLWCFEGTRRGSSTGCLREVSNDA